MDVDEGAGLILVPIRRQGDQVLCEALFKLFGQKCSICNQPDSFDEEIISFLLCFSVN
jgi:NADPH-dependent 7-cyano-7-deazaguanine reductase QueF